MRAKAWDLISATTGRLWCLGKPLFSLLSNGNYRSVHFIGLIGELGYMPGRRGREWYAMMDMSLVLPLKASLTHNETELYSSSCKYTIGYVRTYILPIFHSTLLTQQGRGGGGATTSGSLPAFFQGCKGKYF